MSAAVLPILMSSVEPLVCSFVLFCFVFPPSLVLCDNAKPDSVATIHSVQQDYTVKAVTRRYDTR